MLCYVISSRFLFFFFTSPSFKALNPHSAKYEDGKGDNSFLAHLIEFGYYISVTSQSHTIAHFILNEVLTDQSVLHDTDYSTNISCFIHIGKSENIPF